MIKSYKFNQKLAKDSYEAIKAMFPQHVATAHEIVADYLKKYDRRRLRIFLGETADPEYEGYMIHNAHYLISSMLNEVEQGNPVATPENIDIYARLYLKLPYAVIEGGKTMSEELS